MNSSSQANPSKPRSWKFRNWRTFFFLVFVLALVLLGTSETVRQYQDKRFVREVAANAAHLKDARDEIAVIVALRDYVRQHVGARDFSLDRPLLRHTAVETLRSGKGFCGEGTRVFINLADARGIRAQRLYLEGRQPHVVALVTLKTGEQVIADSWEKPFFPELTSLARFSQQSEFNYYSSFNPAKSPIYPPANTISLGPLAYYLENPHSLKASLYFGLIAGAVGIKLVRRGLRRNRLKTPPRERNRRTELSEHT